MDVKLGELGTWLGGRDFTPNGIFSAARRGEDSCRLLRFSSLTLCHVSPVPRFLPGHQRYYNKYINVKKGGIGGIAMLVVGYVAISYMWEYDHISKTHYSLHFSLCSL